MLANVAAERAVLAGVCRYGLDAYLEVSPILNQETFTVDNNRVMYKCIEHSLKNGQTVDFATLLASAQDLHLDEYVNRVDVLKHFRAVLETPINIDNVYEHAARIRRLQFGRDIQEKARDIYKSVNKITGNESLAQILALAENPIQQISLDYVKEDKSTPKELGADIDAYISHLIENPCTMVGLSTGLPDFDKAIGGGLRRKCVDVVGSRTGVGKSVFCDNVAIHVAGQGIPVFVLDTEMSEEDHYNRILANIANVPINEIATGQFSKDHQKMAAVLAAAKKLKEMPYHYLSVAGKPFDETLSIIRRWLLKTVGYDENSRMRDCLVIYDYLKLMSTGEVADLKEYQVLGFNITQLHNLAVDYDFPCLTFSQLNRDGITKESTDVVSGSDRIIWLCTSFSILKEKTEEEIATDGIRAGNRKLKCLKTRHGAGSQESGYICLQMEGQYARLKHIGAVRELGKSKDFQTKPRNSEEEDGESLESSFS